MQGNPTTEPNPTTRLTDTHASCSRPTPCNNTVRNRGPRSLLPLWLLRPVVGTFHGLGNGTDTYITTQEGADSRFQNY